MAEPATARFRGEIRSDEPLARYTSWRVGGPARRVCRPADVDDLAAMLAGLPTGEPLLWLGLGSNLLVRDGGFAGTVIFTGGLDRLECTGETGVYAQAGVACPKLARFAARNARVGGEFFAGIPGTVGGALAMNAGAWGGETWEHVERVQTVNREGRLRWREPGDFEVGYRHVHGPGGEWFVAAGLAFEAGDGEASRARIRALMAERAERQPMGQASCGSVFRNPPGDHAARLIEACGLKGEAVGGARVSDKHANFIINTGDARAADIEALIERVRATVADRAGVELQTEVRIVGEAP